MAQKLFRPAEQYTLLHTNSPVVREGPNSLIVDLLPSREHINRCYVGLATGSFLTIRYTKDDHGPPGFIRSCPVCKARADQRHFLDSCPANVVPRDILRRFLPRKYTIPCLTSGDFYSLYTYIRHLQIMSIEKINDDDPFPAELLENISVAASELANLFVSNTLSLFISES